MKIELQERSMSKENRNDFFSWWSDELTPALGEAGKGLESLLRKWIEFTKTFSVTLNDFIEDHKETIQAWLKLADVYPTLKPYIDNLTNDLQHPDFLFANHVLDFAQTIESINLEEEPQSFDLLYVISSEAFQKSLTSLYAILPLNKKRLDIIGEALMLHNMRYFGGSVTLLYGLIEGILTESFERAKYIKRVGGKVYPMDQTGSVDKAKPLPGLVPKIEHAIARKDEIETFYRHIKMYQLVSGDDSQTIPKTRNVILHGSRLDFQSEKISAQLILWLYSTLLHLQRL